MSHLRELLRRVKDNFGIPYPFVASVMDYVEYFDDWTTDEREQSIELLRRYGVDNNTNTTVLLARHYGAKHNWKRACIRCGRVMNGETRCIRGMGPSCHDIVGDGPMKEVYTLPPPEMMKPGKLDPTKFLQWKRGKENDG